MGGEIFLTAFGVIVTVGSVVLGLGAYLVPTIVALVRKAPNTASIAAINVLLGWSLIGWVVSLAMALRSTTPNNSGPVTVIQNASPPPPPYATWEPPRPPALPPADDPTWPPDTR